MVAIYLRFLSRLFLIRSHRNFMKKCIFIALIVVWFQVLSGCKFTTHSMNDNRFSKVIGFEIVTKQQLRLYRIDPDLNYDSKYHLITEGYFPFTETDNGEIGVLPIGHRVRFEKLRSIHTPDGVSESLLGTTVFEGKVYPISYRLGFAGDNAGSGWKGIYRSFEIPAQ